MRINHNAGIVYDAVAYTINHFNMKRIHTQHKPFVKNEDDIFENYYEFKKKYAVEPSNDLYLFFYFDGTNLTLMSSYLAECFEDLDYTPQLVLELFQDKAKFRKFAYRYYLYPLKKDVDVKAVINGDDRNMAKASVLLTSIHNDYPLLIHKLFYEFDELVDELIHFLKLIFDNVGKYRKTKKREFYRTAVDNFLNSDKANEVHKSHYIDKKVNFNKQMFAVSLFRSLVIYISPSRSIEATLIIGNKVNPYISGNYNYRHITKISASTIFTTQAMSDIIDILMKEGEKSVTQLCIRLPYSRTNITEYIKKSFVKASGFFHIPPVFRT